MLYRCISQIQRAGNIAALYYCLGRFLEVSKQFRFLGGYECQLADSPFDDDCPLAYRVCRQPWESAAIGNWGLSYRSPYHKRLPHASNVKQAR